MIKTVTLDLDDFSVLRSRMDLLCELRERLPGFKVSLFTIPFDVDYEMSELRLYRDDSLKRIIENKDWMEFIPHGAIHAPREFEKADEETMREYLKGVFDEMKRGGLPEDRFVKGFKAPFWLWNEQVVKVLDEEGWFGATDRNQLDMIRPKRNFVYTHSIDEKFWESDQETIHLHGHMTLPSANNLPDCMLNLIKLPRDVNWKFVSEFV